MQKRSLDAPQLKLKGTQQILDLLRAISIEPTTKKQQGIAALL